MLQAKLIIDQGELGFLGRATTQNLRRIELRRNGASTGWGNHNVGKERAATHFLQKLFFLRDRQHTTITHILGSNSRCSGLFLVSLLYSITQHTCCESYIRSYPSLYTIQQSIAAYYDKQVMGFGRPTPASSGVSRFGSSANTIGYPLNFVFYPPPGVPLIPSHSANQGDSGHGRPFFEDPEPTPYPTSPVLAGSIPTETNEAASMLGVNLGPSSLSHVFPFSLPSSTAPESKVDEREPTLAPPAPQQGLPRKYYLHRTPTGKLTEIGPSPLCQETTKSLLEEAAEKPGKGPICAGHRIFNEDPRKFLGLKSGPEQDKPNEKNLVTGFSASSEEVEEKSGNGLVYAGYRIWNEDPRKFLGLKSGSEQDEANRKAVDTDFNATLKGKEFVYGFDIELPPDEPSSFPFLPDNETADGYASESSYGSSSIRRTFSISSKSLGPLELCSEPINFEESAQYSLVNDQSPEETKQTRGQNLTITIPTKSQPLFNPSLKQDVRFNHQVAERPIDPDSRDLARTQFKLRKGALWNMANKDLEEIFLHATLLFESEFLDLIFCEEDEVKTWLDRHGNRLIQRSMQKWTRANDALKNAGIRPCEINEEVRDIFALMTLQEQAEFIKRYQKLFALVKSSQEGLHLTPSEMEHFSKLSLADKYDFIEEYKTRKEEREKIVRRNTAIFTAKLRRTHRESDELPFADCSSPASLQSLNGLTPKTLRMSANTTVDNLYIKFLQFSMGKEKVGPLDSLSTSANDLPTPLFASPVMTKADSKVDSSDEQQTQRRPTTFTGDGRTRHWKCDEAKTTDKLVKSNQISGLVVKYDTGFGSEESFINVHELLASVEEETSEIVKQAVEIKSYAEVLKQDLKQEVSTNNFESKVLDNPFQDCSRVATSLLSEVLNHQNDHKEDVDTEEDDTPEPLWSKLVLVRSPRKEWLGLHPGAKVAVPSPPPTEHSAEGVISPVTSEHPLVDEQPLNNLCTKSEPCTPGTCEYRDILTKDLEKCTFQVEVLR
jgi:hypothetical protein